MSEQSIQIGNVTIDSVERLPNGVLRKMGVHSRLRSASLEDDVRSIANKSLRRLVMMVYNIEHSAYDITRLDSPIMVEYCEKFLGCSKRTAYDYAKTLLLVCTILQ